MAGTKPSKPGTAQKPQRFKKEELYQPLEIPFFKVDGVAGAITSSTDVRFNLYQWVPRYPHSKADRKNMRRVCCTLSISVPEFISVFEWMGRVVGDLEKAGIIEKVPPAKEQKPPK